MFTSIGLLNRFKPRLLKDETRIGSTLQMQAGVVPLAVIKNHSCRRRDKKSGRRNNASSWNQGESRKSICLEGCRYEVVRRMALEMNFKEVGEQDIWNIIWTDVPISLDKALEMRRFQDAHSIFWGAESPLQKANHFPGMNEICRKDRLARNLNRMKRGFPVEYSFFPRTWSLPADISDLLMHARVRKNATYICKPDSGCQGRGIFLIRNLKKLNPFVKVICQVYIPRPLLIDGYKFDLRIYILITSCDPLRIYIYNEGIARFATVKYSPPTDQNVDIVYMHLTNYSLNKFSQSYVPEGEGSKRKLSTVYDYLLARGANVEKLSADIDDLVAKTMIAAQPTLRHYYRASFPKHDRGCACFEILGFDILIDEDMKPWLLEVNHSPSFNLDLPVDAEIKESLLRDTFGKIYLGGAGEDRPRLEHRRSGLPSSNANFTLDKAGNQVSRALQIQFHHETLHQGNYRLIYPADNCQKYVDLFNQNHNHVTVTDVTSTPPKRRPEGRIAIGDKNDKYEFLPVQSENYVVTRTIDKNGTVCTTKKSKNVSSFLMEYDPECPGKLEFNSPEVNQPVYSVPMPNNPVFHGHGVYQYDEVDFDVNPDQYTASDQLNNNFPPTNGNGGDQSSHPVQEPVKKLVRRNFAREALVLAQERIAMKTGDGKNLKLPPFERGSKSENLELSESNKGLKKTKLKLPPLARAPSVQLKGPEVNYKVYVSRQDQVSVFKYPAPGQDLASSLAPNLFERSNVVPQQVDEEEDDDLDKYFSIKEPKRQRRKQISPQHERRKSNEITKRNLEKNKPKNNLSADKNKLIEQWIKEGARERAKGMEQNSADALQNSMHSMTQRIPKHESWVTMSEEDKTTTKKVDAYLKSSKGHSNRSSRNKSPVNLTPNLEQEESERKTQLRNREKTIRQLGVEAQAFQVVKRSGRMKVEDEYLYNKIFPEEDYYSYLHPPSRNRFSRSDYVGDRRSSAHNQDPMLKYRPFATKYQPFLRSPVASQDSFHQTW